MTSPGTSICIPVFNGAETLEATLESAFSQDLQDIEILLIDNASTDDTLEIAERWRPHGLKIHRNKRNIGFNGNFNRCLELARGEYILILSADDLLYPHAARELSQALKLTPDAALAIASADLIDLDGNPAGCQQLPFDDGLLHGHDMLRYMLTERYPVILNTTMFHRQRALQAGGFDHRFVNSDFFLIAMLCYQWHAICIGRSQGCYRIVPDSTGEQLLYGKPDMLRQKLMLTDAIFERLDETWQDIHQSARTRWIRFAEGMLIPMRLRYGWSSSRQLAADIVKHSPRRLVHPRYLVSATIALLLPRRLARWLFVLAARLTGKAGAAVQRSVS